jgi:hypothetical protein
MAIKILSGILVVRDQHEGRVVIDLDTNSIHDGTPDVTVQKTKMVGSGRYSDTPCKMVALREIDVSVVHPRGIHIRDEVEHNRLKIDDYSIDERYMEIRWDGIGSIIEEISYMVIGEVA